MSTAIEEKPTGAAADLETRKLALGHANDVFNDATTDDSAAAGTTPAAEGIKTNLEPEVEVETKPASNDDLVEALKKAFPQPAAPKEEPKQLTQAEIDTALGAPEVTDELLAQLDDPAKRKEIMAKLLKDAGLHGAKMASVVLEAKMNELAGPLRELQEARAQEVHAAHEKTFFDEYPTLNKPEFKPILEIVTQRLMADPANAPKTPADRRKKLAEETEKVLKAANPAFVLSAPSTTQQKPKSTVPRQAVAATTGGGGTVSKGQPDPEAGEKNRSKGTEVFD